MKVSRIFSNYLVFFTVFGPSSIRDPFSRNAYLKIFLNKSFIL